MRGEWIDETQLAGIKNRISARFEQSLPVFTMRKVADLGISRPEVLALHRRGDVYRIRHGAYCLSEYWEAAQSDPSLRRRILALAAMAGMRQPVFGFGPFAAELHELPLPPGAPEFVDLVRDSRRDTRPAQGGVQPRNRLDGVRIISRNLSGEDVTAIAGIPVVGLATAAMTSAVDSDDEYAMALLDAALRSGSSRNDLLEIGARWSSTKGMAAAMRLVDQARAGAESALESISRVRLVDRGLPEPVLQKEFHDRRGFIGRVDMWWPKWRVIGEADGLGKYDDPRVLRMEKIREDRLRALGLRVVRWTWNEIWTHPGDVVSRILAAREGEAVARWAG